MPNVFTALFKKQKQEKEPVRPAYVRPTRLLEDDLVAGFNPLSLRDDYAPSPPQTKKHDQRSGQFVGGFRPSQSQPVSHPALSLTMRHALDLPQNHASTSLNVSSAYNFDHSRSAPHIPSPATAPPSSTLPVKPARRRASSDAPVVISVDPSSLSQCSGITKANKRCTRQVKSGPALAQIMGAATVERFCHQHAKELMVDPGFHSRKNGKLVNFADWIPDYLHVDTQAALRVEMEKSRSVSDVPGYIYTFEILDSKTPNLVHLKVGRAVNLTKRLDQWKTQCSSKSQILRGFYPGTVDVDETSFMKGRIQAGDKGAFCHRLERLVHLELADLMLYTPYLQEGWPTRPTQPKATTIAKKADPKPCKDCGQVHKEIFSFKRVPSGRYKDKEWELIVQPVIQRWGAFVEAYV